MKIEVDKKDDIILFQDIDEKDGRVLAEIGFQYNQGRFSVYMNGYSIDDKKFPALQGYYGYTMTEDELNEFKEFLRGKVIEKC